MSRATRTEISRWPTSVVDAGFYVTQWDVNSEEGILVNHDDHRLALPAHRAERRRPSARA